MSDTLKKIYFVDDLGYLPLLLHMQEHAVQTECLPMVILLHCPIHAMHRQQLYLQEEVSDGVIAPGYTQEALEILKTKRKGNYNVIQIDEAYQPAPIEHKDVYGITFEQGRNEIKINEEMLQKYCK